MGYICTENLRFKQIQAVFTYKIAFLGKYELYLHRNGDLL